MKGEIDTHLFLEIIQSEGVNLMYGETTEHGERVEFFHGLSGKKVLIIVSDEFITERTAKAYLRQLGLDDLVERLFYEE
jgi:hypothetical protein